MIMLALGYKSEIESSQKKQSGLDSCFSTVSAHRRQLLNEKIAAKRLPRRQRLCYYQQVQQWQRRGHHDTKRSEA